MDTILTYYIGVTMALAFLVLFCSVGSRKCRRPVPPAPPRATALPVGQKKLLDLVVDNTMRVA